MFLGQMMHLYHARPFNHKIMKILGRCRRGGQGRMQIICCPQNGNAQLASPSAFYPLTKLLYIMT
jgi:hypothetical protein